MSGEEAPDAAEGSSANVGERLAALESDFEAKLEDVRGRVVQVKREIDGKAPADHDHDQEELVERNEALEEQYEALVERVGALEEALDEVEPQEPRAPAGIEETVRGHADAIERLEERVEVLAASAVDAQDEVDELTGVVGRLEEQAEAVGDLSEKVETVAGSVLDVQDRVEAIDDAVTGRAELTRLRDSANRADVRRARCADCQEKLAVGLLTEAACPHCGADFVDVEPGGLLRAGLLTTDADDGGPDEHGGDAGGDDARSVTGAAGAREDEGG